MTEYRGNCHCGSVEFEFAAERIVNGMRCNCSICRRKGAVLSSFTLREDQLRIRAADGALATYRFGTAVAAHHFCRRCGIFTFVETRLNPGEYRVNLGCIDALDVFGLPVTLYDGRSI